MKLRAVPLLCALIAATAAHAQGNDTLAKIKASGTIVQGVRESSGALAYTLGNGIYTGFHYDVCTNIINDLKQMPGMSALKVSYQAVTSGNRIPLTRNGTIDIECGSTTNDENRQKEVAFASTLFVEEVRIAVRADSPIQSVADLKDKTVVTTTGTTSVQLLRQSKRGQGLEFRELQGKDHSDSFLLLEAGRADAFVMDGQILAGAIARAKNPKQFKIVGEPLSVEPIAIMLRRDDPAFKKAVDESIARQVKDGSVAKLYDKWFMQPVPPTNTTLNLPASAATRGAWANLNDKPKEAYVVE